MPRAKIKVNILIPMYHARIEVYIGTGADVYRGWPQGIDQATRDEDYMGRCFNVGQNEFKVPRKSINILIHCKEFKISTVAHEACHAASFIFRDIGIDASHDNDEAFAYMVGYIVECVSKKTEIKPIIKMFICRMTHGYSHD